MNNPDDRLRETIVELDPDQERANGTWNPESGPPVMVAEVDGQHFTHRFNSTFRIGRGEDCDLRIDSTEVSRGHAEVYWANGAWRVRDIGSTNGTYLEGLKVEVANLGPRNALRLGAKGPIIWLTTEQAGSTEKINEQTVSHYIRRYVEGDPSPDAAGHTQMVRKAVATVSEQQRRRHLKILGTVSTVLVVALLLVWQFRASQIRRSHKTAGDIFYSMKDLELRLARLEDQVDSSEDVADGQSQLRGMSQSYDRYIAELGVFDDDTPEQKRLVLRMARLFGECEAAMPASMLEEVERFIKIWQSDTRLKNALQRASKGGFAARVAETFDRYHLPPQYFYLALQESDFRLDACGPVTRYGIAKGPWQFIPGTANAYGLRVGPLYLQRKPDPQDERHDFGQASDAAARYIRDIYLREAQGSGLLSLAIYNYGGGNVRRLIRSLPESSRERNFWRLLIDHRDRFPRETYDYVFRVFSAAVIGENPQLFGFDFSNPLLDKSIEE